MAHTDVRGLPISTSSAAAAQLYRCGCDLLLAAWPGAMEKLNEAVAADPDFALAHASLARLYAIRAEPVKAQAAIAVAAELASRCSSPREQSHIAALSLAVHGKAQQALEAVLSHIEKWPHDAIILSMPLGAFGLFAFSGMADHDAARVDLCDRVAPHFDTSDWWFLTYRGWSHVENGAVSTGRDLCERGLALRRANANAAHALSHAMFEQGANEEAEALIEAWLPTYDRSGALHGHIAWHAALSALDRDDPHGAIDVYERYVQPSASQGMPINIMTDAVSLLWRLQTYGYDVPGNLWADAKAYANAHFPKAGHAFIDAHMGLLAAATGEMTFATQRIDALNQLVEAGTMAAGPVVPAICRAALAFASGDYARCVALLEPVRSDVARIGGSGAQREIVEDTLLVALMRNGETAKARAMLDARLHRRPSARDTRWRSRLDT